MGNIASSRTLDAKVFKKQVIHAPVGPKRMGRPPFRAPLLPRMPMPGICVQSLMSGMRAQTMRNTRLNQELLREPHASLRSLQGASSAPVGIHTHMRACAHCCNDDALEARGRLPPRVSACCACSFNSLVVETTFGPDSQDFPSHCSEGLRFLGVLYKVSCLHALTLLKCDAGMIEFSFCVAPAWVRSELWCNAACNKRARTRTGEEEHLIHLAPSCVPAVNTSPAYLASIQHVLDVDSQLCSERGPTPFPLPAPGTGLQALQFFAVVIGLDGRMIVPPPLIADTPQGCTPRMWE